MNGFIMFGIMFMTATGMENSPQSFDVNTVSVSFRGDVRGESGGCFTNVSRALQKILSKFVYCTNSTCDENFRLKLCTCAQSLALGTRTNFQIEILIINVISGVVYFRENILGSSRNVSETAPRPQRTRLSQLENSAISAQFTRTIIPDSFQKWRDIKFRYSC